MKRDVDIDRALERPYTFSWFQRETVPARRTWWDRLWLRHLTTKVWRRHVVVLRVEAVKVDAFGGWPAIFDAFLLPMIPAGAGGAGPWGTQIEEGDGPRIESIHADRGGKPA